MRTTLKTGTLYLTISSLLFITIGYLLNIWLGRFLGPAIYGSYGVIVALISLVNLIQTSGLTQSASKYIAEDENLSDAIFKSAFHIQMIATLIISIFFFIFSYPLAHILNDLSLAPYLQLSAFVFPVYGFYALLIDYYNGLHYFKKQALLNSLYSVTKAAGVVFFAYLFYLKGVIFGYILSPIVAIAIGFYYPKSVTVTFPYKKLILFSIPLIGYIIFSTLLQSIDLYFVKSFLSGAASGYYTASQNISRLVYFGTIAISSVLLPSISSSVSQKLYDKTKATIATSLRTALLLIVPGILLISATSKPLLQLIYSQTYIPAAESLSILTISFGFFTMFSLLCTIVNGAGSPRISFTLAVIGVVLNTVGSFLLIPIFQLTGAAIASLISNLVVMTLSAFLVYKRFHQLVYLTSFLRIIFASSVIYAFAIFIKIPYFFLPILYILLFLIYISLLILLQEITKDDLIFVRSLFPNKKNK